jgi:predicted transcriptional regulator
MMRVELVEWSVQSQIEQQRLAAPLEIDESVVARLVAGRRANHIARLRTFFVVGPEQAGQRRPWRKCQRHGGCCLEKSHDGCKKQ